MKEPFIDKFGKLLPTKRNWFGWCSLVLTVVIAVFWVGNTPLHTDDFYYQFMPGPDNSTSMWYACNEYITSFSQVPEAIRNHYLQINGRLSNYAYLAVQPLPYEIIKYFCGLMLGLLGFMFWQWCGRKSLENGGLAIAVPLLLWTGLQWNDQMQSSDFHFNYVIPSVLIMGCLIRFFKKASPGIVGWILICFLAVWHEGFTVVFGVFLGVQWLYERKRDFLIAICILIAGTLLQYSPGTHDLAVNSFGRPSLPISLVLSKGWVSLIAIAWWLLRRKSLEKREKRTIDRFAVGVIVSWIPALVWIFWLSSAQRAHWPNDVLAIALTLMLIRTYKPLTIKVPVKVVLLALYALWGASLVYWQYRVKVFTNYCLEELKTGKTVLLDRDDFLSEDIPFWLMDIPRIQYSTQHHWEHRSMPFTTSHGKNNTYIILPDSLYGKPFEEWPKVPGKNDMRFAGKNILVRKYDGTRWLDRPVTLQLGPANMSVTPLDLGLGLLIGNSIDKAEKSMTFRWADPFEYQGDTLEVVSLYNLPRTVYGRQVTALDTP